MDIGSGIKQILVKLDRLPNATQNFTITTTTTKFTVKSFCLFAIMKLEQPWKIRNVMTNERSDLKQWAWVSRSQHKILTDIISEGNPRVLALFVHTHNFEYVRPARSRTEDDIATV
jgi:hypothetical protein